MEEIENLLKLIPKNLSYTEAEEWAQKIFQTYCADVHGSDIAFRLLVVDLLKYSANVELGERNANDFKTGAGSFGVDQAAEFMATVGGFVLDQTREILRTLQTVDVSGLTKQYKKFEEAARGMQLAKFLRGAIHVGAMIGIGLIVCLGCWIWNSTLSRERDKLREEVEVLKESKANLAAHRITLGRIQGTSNNYRIILPPGGYFSSFDVTPDGRNSIETTMPR
jgi:hypothetical protein